MIIGYAVNFYVTALLEYLYLERCKDCASMHFIEQRWRDSNHFSYPCNGSHMILGGSGIILEFYIVLF